jgi:hypothetical protein
MQGIVIQVSSEARISCITFDARLPFEAPFRLKAAAKRCNPEDCYTGKINKQGFLYNFSRFS